jgi:hypothetical protein
VVHGLSQKIALRLIISLLLVVEGVAVLDLLLRQAVVVLVELLLDQIILWLQDKHTPLLSGVVDLLLRQVHPLLEFQAATHHLRSHQILL